MGKILKILSTLNGFSQFMSAAYASHSMPTNKVFCSLLIGSIDNTSVRNGSDHHLAVSKLIAKLFITCLEKTNTYYVKSIILGATICIICGYRVSKRKVPIVRPPHVLHCRGEVPWREKHLDSKLVQLCPAPG